jgi:membrane-bound metal-dependent hydrolase YbcI (DUF457 family)
MFTGHFAVALAAAGRSPKLPLGVLIVAAFIGDLTEAVVAALNIPDPTRAWSHSIPATAAAGLCLALGWRLAGGSWNEALVLVLVSVSHSALDFLTGHKTMWPGTAPMGFNLYRRPVPEFVLEILAVLAGWSIWRSAVPADRRASRPVWLMLAMLVAAQTAVLAGILLLGPDIDNEAMSKFVR